MKSKRLFSLVMSFVMAITFCCSEAQVAAKGSAAAAAKVALSNTFGFLGTAGFATLACLFRQKNKVAARPPAVAAGDPEEIPIPVFDTGEIPIPEELQPVGQGIQNAIDLVNGLMPTYNEADASAFLQEIEYAVYELRKRFEEQIAKILRSCGVTAIATTPEGAITGIDVDGASVTVHPQTKWREEANSYGYPPQYQLLLVWTPLMGKKPVASLPAPKAGTTLRRFSPLSGAAIATMLAMVTGDWNPATLAEAMPGMWAVINLLHNWVELWRTRLHGYAREWGAELQFDGDYVDLGDYFAEVPPSRMLDAGAPEASTPGRLFATVVSAAYPTTLTPILLSDQRYSSDWMPPR
ncbi:MAG: hypothetical protein LBJ38_00240 [Oscillospiraceae bacterium]|jgi:hypothetical protein|nr:hypothetical protein [Oscillospiraceae bacterium]